MISKVSEPKMHLTRWVLVVGWLIVVVFSFYDPLSFWLTDASNLASPFHLKSGACVLVQGLCLPQVNYVLGPRIFWGAIVPAGIIILLVGGHEFWRRICPLSFISQIPRRLGLQRKHTKINPETGAQRQELVGVKANSWLGQNFLYLQLGLFFIGLNIRLLVANGSGVGFATFMLVTFAAALTVGYLFKGKSWCQYFCPMAPVQTFYNGTRGLLGSDAHLSPPATVTQSMCRTVDEQGREKSGCVSCQSPCIDIDAERLYWQSLDRPDRQLLFYGYFGLMSGFFLYFYLYAGNWDYYYSGLWSHDVHQFSSLFGAGFYLFDRAIPIPKIVAAPLTLAVCTALSYYSGKYSERLYRLYTIRRRQKLTKEQIRHNCYTIWVFLSFNVFFVFAGRPNLRMFPSWVELLFNAFLILVSTLWLQRTWHRSQPRYQKENLTSSLRRQLQKLGTNWKEFLEGRDLADLGTDEIYVLAKVLPGFSQESRSQVYRGVLQEALVSGKTQSANSLEMLQDIRTELKISEEDHYQMLAELGIEDPQLLDPDVQRSQEDRLRLDGYRRGLELLLMESIASNIPVAAAIEGKMPQINALRQEYGISNDEQERVLGIMFEPNSLLLNTSAALLTRLQILSMRHQALTSLPHNPQASVYQLLRGSLSEQQEAIVRQLLKIIELLDDAPTAIPIARTTGLLARLVVRKVLDPAQSNLAPTIVDLLTATTTIPPDEHPTITDDTFSGEITPTTMHRALSQIDRIATVGLTPPSLIEVLQQTIWEVDPLVKAASLHALHKLDRATAQQVAQQITGVLEPLLQETVDRIVGKIAAHPSNAIPVLEIEIRSGDRQEHRTYQQAIVRIGRAIDNDIAILDPRMSRYHAQLTSDERGVTVQDLGSSNGLRIDGRSLHDTAHLLKTKDTIYFSPTDDLSLTIERSVTATSSQPTKYLSTMDKLLRLHASPLFQDIPPQRLVELARRSELKLYQTGEPICTADTIANQLWLLVAGSARSGDVKFLPGQTIGEMAILTASTYTETIVATGPKNPTLVISAADFNELITNDPIVARMLLTFVSRRWQIRSQEHELKIVGVGSQELLAGNVRTGISVTPERSRGTSWHNIDAN
jgi:pSer/pThr/pTyr-binding forkhead associated (FHA) protein